MEFWLLVVRNIWGKNSLYVGNFRDFAAETGGTLVITNLSKANDMCILR
jgi:hypothetical protein